MLFLTNNVHLISIFVNTYVRLGNWIGKNWFIHKGKCKVRVRVRLGLGLGLVIISNT